ncbi:hypothetical protein D910_12360 [Dendroctonus ponderosae]|uniref:Uncharacterized protein n=1 Tax=Dendroctonus ponderosae TaxID=77166 RepID=U4UXR8_DENPD|nr:hypothetical protein D910_12360 [Dendroctonus ponderosae]
MYQYDATSGAPLPVGFSAINLSVKCVTTAQAVQMKGSGPHTSPGGTVIDLSTSSVTTTSPQSIFIQPPDRKNHRRSTSMNSEYITSNSAVSMVCYAYNAAIFAESRNDQQRQLFKFSQTSQQLNMDIEVAYGSPHYGGQRVGGSPQAAASPHLSASPQVPSPQGQTLDLSVSRLSHSVEKQERAKEGVAIAVYNQYQKAIQECRYISSRILAVKIVAEDQQLTIISIYAPQDDKPKNKLKKNIKETAKEALDTVIKYNSKKLNGSLKKTEESYEQYKQSRRETAALVRPTKEEDWERFSKRMETDCYGLQKQIWRSLRNEPNEIKELNELNPIKKETCTQYLTDL